MDGKPFFALMNELMALQGGPENAELAETHNLGTRH